MKIFSSIFLIFLWTAIDIDIIYANVDYCSMFCFKETQHCFNAHYYKTEGLPYDKTCEIKHIACNNTEKFIGDCYEGRPVEITDDIKDLFVAEHNRIRNNIAGGKHGFGPACRMATMKWDNELAYIATLNTLACAEIHDNCRATKVYHASGQNIGVMPLYDGYPFDITGVIKSILSGFYGEYKKITVDDITYQNDTVTSKAGHFTTIVQESNIAIGCGISIFREPRNPGMQIMKITCNYATTSVLYTSVFDRCKKAAFKCKNGKNTKYPYLCSEKEEYDVNKFGKYIMLSP